MRTDRPGSGGGSSDDDGTADQGRGDRGGSGGGSGGGSSDDDGTADQGRGDNWRDGGHQGGFPRSIRAVEPPILRYAVAPTGVATITLDDPGTRNSLSWPMLEQLLDALARARADDAVRCVVLASSHPTVFSSGANLAGFAADVALIERHRDGDRLPAVFAAFGELGKPSLCAASGHVLAGALGLALACDLVIARAGARFGLPEVNVGAFPFMVCALLYRNVGAKRAAELLLLGEQIEAEEAQAYGLVNRVVPAEEFDSAVAGWAERLAAKSPLVMRLGKDAMHRQRDMAFADALEYLHAQLTLALSTDDLHEGITAI